MSEIIAHANQVVRNAVAELRELAGKALADHAYGEVAKIAGLAEAVAAVLGEQPRPPKQATPEPSQKQSSTSPKTSRTSRSRPAKGAYPRFEREGNKLVKIGWSKKSRSEYEHRAPFSVAEHLVTAIAKKVTEGELFAATDILPVQGEGNEAIPDYQVYLALKWLHMEGVVAKHGRDRYAIEPGRLDDSTLPRLRDSLPTFKGA